MGLHVILNFWIPIRLVMILWVIFLIDLEPLALEEGTDFTKWFPLHQRKKRDKVLGDIQLTITLDHVKDEKSEKNHQLGFLHCSAPKLRNTANFSTDKNTM